MTSQEHHLFKKSTHCHSLRKSFWMITAIKLIKFPTVHLWGESTVKQLIMWTEFPCHDVITMLVYVKYNLYSFTSAIHVPHQRYFDTLALGAISIRRAVPSCKTATPCRTCSDMFFQFWFDVRAKCFQIISYALQDDVMACCTVF